MRSFGTDRHTDTYKFDCQTLALSLKYSNYAIKGESYCNYKSILSPLPSPLCRELFE